jgi:hypothetical protein
MDKFANPPPNKSPSYYVVLRPKVLSPMQIGIMHDIACLMIDQNQQYALKLPYVARCNLPTRFKKRVPAIVSSLPTVAQKFVSRICKQGIDPKKPCEVGNLGFDSGYDWYCAFAIALSFFTCFLTKNCRQLLCAICRPSHLQID